VSARVGSALAGRVLDVYEGHILGFGTADGRRVVVGRWLRAPWPRFADVMTEDASGHRTLVAPTRSTADEVAATYAFDEVVLAPVRVRCDAAARRWRVTAGPLDADVTLGGPTALGRLLAAVPRPLARSCAFATAVDPVARVLVPGVRTRGSAGAERREWYGATGQWGVVAVRATWDDVPCGGLLATVEPVRFGFSSLPGRPSVTAVRTTFARPGERAGAGRA